MTFGRTFILSVSAGVLFALVSARALFVLYL